MGCRKQSHEDDHKWDRKHPSRLEGATGPEGGDTKPQHRGSSSSNSHSSQPSDRHGDPSRTDKRSDSRSSKDREVRGKAERRGSSDSTSRTADKHSGRDHASQDKDEPPKLHRQVGLA